MDNMNKYVELLKEVRLHQFEMLEKFGGYDNLPEDYKKDFDEIQQHLLDSMKYL